MTARRLHRRAWNRRRNEQLVDDLIRRDFLRLCCEVEQDTMTQHGMYERANVVEAHVAAPLEKRTRLSAKHECLRRANAGAVIQELLHEIRSVDVVRTGHAYEA